MVYVTNPTPPGSDDKPYAMHEQQRITADHLLVQQNDSNSDGTTSLVLDVPDDEVRFLVLLSTAAKCAVLRLDAAVGLSSHWGIGLHSLPGVILVRFFTGAAAVTAVECVF